MYPHFKLPQNTTILYLHIYKINSLRFIFLYLQYKFLIFVVRINNEVIKIFNFIIYYNFIF